MTPTVAQARRVVARYKGAMEHPSEEARKEYLKEHPQADPSNHTVTEHEDEEGGAEEELEGKEKKPEKKPSAGNKAKAFFKGLSDKAKAFVSNSSAEVQKFVSDPDHRKQTMVSAAKAVKDSPKVYAKRVVETARHEVHEFREAGEAIGVVIKGGKMSSKQKKAVTTVAIHMGIALTAAALTSTGVLAGAAVLGKGMAQKIALKAAARALENVHLAQEISHIGHGAHALAHIFTAAAEEEKSEKIGSEEVLAILVLQSVLKELEDFSDEDMTAVLEEASGETQKMAYVLAKVDQLEPALESMMTILSEVPVKDFDRILVAARAGSETLKNRVWQRYFSLHLNRTYDKISELGDPKEILEDIAAGYKVQTLTVLIWQALTAISVPRKASPDYAISDIEFNPDPTTHREEISYSIQVLREWNQELEKWTKEARITLNSLLPKIRRVIKIKALV
jgi:hypothetical protein